MERNERLIYATMAFVAFLLVGGLFASADTTKTSDSESLRYTRDCELATGAWTKIDCSAAAAYSAVLTKNTRYIVQAQSGSPFIRVTTAASAQDPTSADGYLSSGAWAVIKTPDAARYLACLGSADTSFIVYKECQ